MHLHPSHIVDEHSRRIGKWTCPLPADVCIDSAAMLRKLIVQNFISVPSPIIRRDDYLAVGGIDEPLWYTGDWDLYLKIARRGTVVYHDEALSSFRIHSSSLTVTGSQNVEDFRSQMRLVTERHLPALPVEDQRKVLRKARASIEVNTGLAAASKGSGAGLLGAAAAMAGLGPIGCASYMRDARLWERVAPRLRARLAGGL